MGITPEKPKALVIEDIENFATCCKLTLGLAGFDVSIAENHERAMQMLEDNNFKSALILSDFDTKCGMNGAGFIQKYKKMGGEAPIIGISAEMFCNQLMEDAGACASLLKPFRSRELKGLINQHYYRETVPER